MCTFVEYLLACDFLPSSSFSPLSRTHSFALHIARLFAFACVPCICQTVCFVLVEPHRREDFPFKTTNFSTKRKTNVNKKESNQQPRHIPSKWVRPHTHFNWWVNGNEWVRINTDNCITERTWFHTTFSRTKQSSVVSNRNNCNIGISMYPRTQRMYNIWTKWKDKSINWAFVFVHFLRHPSHSPSFLAVQGERKSNSPDKKHNGKFTVC